MQKIINSKCLVDIHVFLSTIHCTKMVHFMFYNFESTTGPISPFVVLAL